MNSSGIKRGLAVSAISALAVAGIPALATSASAAPGDVITVAYAGPARNNGTEGAVIVLKVTAGTVNANNLRIVRSDLQGASAAEGGSIAGPGQQSATFIDDGDAVVADGPTNPNGGQDGFDEVTIRVSPTTPVDGATVSFGVYEEEAGSATAGPDATEPVAQVQLTTAGPVAQLDVAPASQSAAADAESAPYAVTLRDSGGRVTQLNTGEDLDFTITGAGGDIDDVDGNGNPIEAAGNATISAAEAPRGVGRFTAEATATGLQTITVDADEAPNNASATATLDVVTAAGNLTNPNQLDIVTAADSWNGFGDQGQGVLNSGGTITDADDVKVRVDQGSIRLDIRGGAANANATFAIAVDGGVGPANAVRFGGQRNSSLSTVLDANGNGSITITPDAGSIQEGDTFNVTGPGLNLQFDYERAALSRVDAPANRYVSPTTGSVDITVGAFDQFDLPIAGAQIDAQRTGGPSPDVTPQARKTTDANGQATFTFTSTNRTPNSVSTVTFRGYDDQFDATPGPSDTTTIRYTTDGLGADFTVALDGQNTGGTSYDPTSVRVVPLTDTAAPAPAGNVLTGDEVVNLALVAGETGAPFTVSVDNGALILRGAETRLEQGSATETGVVGTDNLRIVGTKSGPVTVTVTSAGRTKTAQFTVVAQSDTSRARNVTVSGPTEAVSGQQQVTFTAVVTDAFGNPVAGVGAGALNVQVSGPGFLQDNDAVTNAAGQLELNVRLDDNAEGPVTITVTGLPSFGQFGAAEDRLVSGPAGPANDGAGLPASSNVATATVLVEDDDTNEPEPKETIVATATGSNRASDGYDRVRITVDKPVAAADAAVELYKVNAKGQVRRVKTKSLNANGRATFVRKDLNGKKSSKYFAKVRPTDTSKGDRTKAVFIK